MVNRLRYSLNKLLHHGVYLSPVKLCIKKEMKMTQKGKKSFETRAEMTTAFKKSVRKCYAIRSSY